ncbi:MAG: hypothetical protein A2W31_11675, partial [Planctomycetes bacterium RBG_16_64_10]
MNGRARLLAGILHGALAMKAALALLLALQLIVGLSQSVLADADNAAFLAGMDAFLQRQMEYFDGIRPLDQPPLVQTFGWDVALPFPPTELGPPPCINPPCAPAPPQDMPWRGDTYDQALAAMWFTDHAKLDLQAGRDPTGHLARARQLLDAGIFLINHDPYADGRLRMAYWANNLLNPPGTGPSILAPDAATGNISFVAMALTRFVQVAKQADYLDSTTRQGYLAAAETLAHWILTNCTDGNPNGFTGGYRGWEQAPIGWKSTEHNIDAWTLSQNLFSLTGNAQWLQMAERAERFVQDMYVVAGDGGYYRTGTLDDGITPNPAPIPADTQAWTALAGDHSRKIDTDARAASAMDWLLDNLTDGCEGSALPGDGVQFSNLGKNLQSEVTASAALALDWLDLDTEAADAFLALLDWLRLNAAPDYDGIEDGLGLVATPCLEGASTGFGWWYYPLTHVASSAWAGFAGLFAEQPEGWLNPFRPLVM